MNEQKFDAKGQTYARFRPLYPEKLLHDLTASGILSPESVVADIGSGTGIFSLQAHGFVKTVFSVEPNKSMREKAELQFKNCPNIFSVSASAENTTLEPSSIDCVFAAQAFHWFDAAAFKQECRRILKPHGYVILLWNNRDESSVLVQRNSEINAKFCEGYQGFSNGMDFNATQPFDTFFNGPYDLKLYENPMQYDLDAFIGRNLSSSFAPQEGQECYAPYVAALETLFHDFSTAGIVEYPYLTRCYIGTV